MKTLKDLIGKNLGVYQQVQVLVQGSMEAISRVERVPGRVDVVRVTLTGGLEHRSLSLLEGTSVSIAEKDKPVAKPKAATKPKGKSKGKTKPKAKKKGAPAVKKSGRKKSAPAVSKP